MSHGLLLIALHQISKCGCITAPATPDCCSIVQFFPLTRTYIRTQQFIQRPGLPFRAFCCVRPKSLLCYQLRAAGVYECDSL